MWGMFPTQFWSLSMNLTIRIWNSQKHRIFRISWNLLGLFFSKLKILYFQKFQNIMVKFKLRDQNWVGIMPNMFSFGFNTKFMANVSSFQNNSFLLKVVYNVVYKWPLTCFSFLLHSFILLYVLRARKTKKSYFRNGAL